MKNKLTAMCLASAMAMTLCACTVEQAAQTAVDTVNSIQTSDSAEVNGVKNGYLTAYSSTVTVGEALDSFLSNPRWSYFVAETGEKIVQCVGGCTYNDENIEAKVQFELNDDDTFQFMALAFNDMSQSTLMAAAFFEKIYEGKESTANSADEGKIDAADEEELTRTDETQYSSGNSARDIVVVDNNQYGLNEFGLEDGTLVQLNQQEVRLLLNALYAYHGYSFTTEEYQSFFESKPWYSPRGKSMEECEAEFTELERFNKNLLVEYETEHGWR